MSVITDGFTESIRYKYNLTPDSLVIDVGAHKGIFSAEMSRQHNCRIEAYEPIDQFYKEALERTKPYPKVFLQKKGVSSVGASAIFGIKGDMTGPFTESEMHEVVSLVCIDDVLRETCDVLKLNIEGSEYDILDYMIRTGLVMKCRNIQVQFHTNVPGCVDRRNKNRDGLLRTHRLTYDFPFCWENYERL